MIAGDLGPQIMPDPNSSIVWIQDVWNLGRFISFDTSTNQYNTETPITPSLVDYLPWQGAVILPTIGTQFLLQTVYTPPSYTNITSSLVIQEIGESEVIQQLGASPNSAQYGFQKMVYANGFLYMLSNDTLLQYNPTTLSVANTWSVTGDPHLNGMLLHDPGRNMLWWVS